MGQETLTIHGTFDKTCGKFPSKPVFKSKKDGIWQQLTYESVKNYSSGVAGFLLKQGFEKGGFAAIILENCPEWGIVYLAIMRAGLIAVPLDYQLSEAEIKNLISESPVRAVFCSSAAIPRAKQALKGKEVIFIDVENSEYFSRIMATGYSDINWPQVSADDTASLIYTSGTTGEPKGVLLSHKNFCSNFVSIQKMNVYNSEDVFLSILPLYHSYAFTANLICPMFIGAQVVYSSGFKPEELLNLIEEAKITILAAVPQLFYLLHKGILARIKKHDFFLRPFVKVLIKAHLKKHLRSLRLMVSGGAKLDTRVGADLIKFGFKLIEGYGLTETSPIATLNPPARIKPGSAGKAIPDVEVRISNPDEKGNGLVIIKGPNVMKGYYKQDKLTRETIKEGWLYTSDLGRIDKEGYLFISGRAEEAIVLSSGKNIYPEELESYYAKTPYIKEICILLKKERIFGSSKDMLHAVIVPDLEYFAKEKKTNIREKIRWDLETLAKGLPTYMHIMGFSLTKEELPRTALRKIKRYEVRKIFLEHAAGQKPESEILSEEDRIISGTGHAQRILGYLSKELNKRVHINDHLELDLGIDSLTRVELALGLESLLKIKVSDEIIYKVASVKDVILATRDLIEAEKPEKKERAQKEWKDILKEPPPEVLLRKVRLCPRKIDIALTWVFKKMFEFCFRVAWLLRVEGLNNLPKEGPFLICPNHASYLDGFLILSSITFKQALNTYFVGYHHIFGHPLVSWSIKVSRLIPIDVAEHLTEAMQAVALIVSHKKIVCIFPEGQRSIDDEVKDFKKGIGILIKELDIPVVPVYIKGSHFSWPRGTKFPRPYPLRVKFGRPLSSEELLRSGRGQLPPADDYEAIARALKEEVLKLI